MYFSESQLYIAKAFALRILVSISAIGSLIVMWMYPPFIFYLFYIFCPAENFFAMRQTAFGLPAGFLNSRDLSFVCQFTEADTADSIFSQIRMRTSADSAAAIFSCGEFRLALLFDFHRCLCHDFPPLFCKRHIELFQ